MGIEIPGWLRWVGDLIGEPFPEGDETACRRQADRWRHYADQLEAHRDGLAAATQTTLSGFTAGDIHNTLDQLLKPYGSSIDQLAGQLRQLADAVDNVATEIEFAKEMFIANLVALAATLVALAASAWINWGAPVEAAAAVAAIELVISQGIRAAAAKVAAEAVARVIAQLVTRALGGAIVNAGFSAGLNAGIQGQQMVQGNRHDFDWESWQNDVKSGAISGAVMGPILKGAHDFDAGSALGNQAKNFGASFVGNAGGAAAAQQALTGHVNLADALGGGAVFGAVDGVRSPGVHSGAPGGTPLTGDRPGTPLVEPLPATLHQQTPIESSPAAAAPPAEVGGARHADVDVPFTLGSPPHDSVPLSASGFAGADSAAAPHPSTTAPALHPGATDAPTAASPASAPPPAGHAATAATGSSAAASTGHASPSTGGPQAPPARAGISDAAAPAGASLRDVAGTHPVRGADVPPREVAAPQSHEITRDATPSRDIPARNDAPPARDTLPARDGTPDSAKRAESERDHGKDIAGQHDSERSPATPHAADAKPPEAAPAPDGFGDSHHDPAPHETDAGDHGPSVASHPDPEHTRGIANEALWKRIPPVHPDEIRHHLADNIFGEQRARDNAAWWHELSGEEQRALIDSYSREIGNAEGIPSWARTAANEHQLSRLHDELQSRRDSGEHLSRRETKDLRRYNEIRRTLDEARTALAGRGEVHILSFDPHAFRGDGRIVVSVGHDPHHADSVSWHVPGITTTIGSLETNLTNARMHLESVHREDPHLKAASIAWIGYDAPSGLALARTPFRGLARAGGAILHSDITAFNAAVKAGGGSGSHVTDNHIFGHSYGSTTTSFAGRDGALAGHVRSITLLGSPGAARQHHASDFKVGDRVFVASSSRDPVTAAGARTPIWRGRVRGIGLGVDPAMRSFGAQRITAEFPLHMDSFGTVGTHTAYYALDPRLGVRTESLANFGRIAAGRFDEVHLEAHRTARPWWATERLTNEPASGRPLRLDPADGKPYSVERRIWDPRWHPDDSDRADHPDGSAHHGDDDHRITGDQGRHRAEDAHDGRCAHEVSGFLSEHFGREVVLRTEPGPTGVPARDLFEAWGSASQFASYEQVRNTLLGCGHGSAALLASHWSGGPGQGGHAYIAVNEHGVVHLYDRVGARFERSGWPPWWGQDAVDRTAVGYLDRHGDAIDPIYGRPDQLESAESVGDVAGAGPAPPRDYDANGHTISTDQLIHPQAGLLDQSLLDTAATNPNRVSDALAPGAPSTHPEVQDMVPNSYDPHGGLSEDVWNRQYWPTGNRDAHGNPELVWPDPGAHPQGFSTPESRTPTVLDPGELFDRFGPGFGMFGSPAGTPFPDRGLPPHSLDAGFHRYEVLRPIPVWEGPIAPAMGQPGGGTQYYFPRSIVDLVNAGYLREIPL